MSPLDSPTSKLIHQDSLSSTSSPFFETCGVQIPLDGQNLPEYQILTHAVPEDCRMFVKEFNNQISYDTTIIVGNRKLYGHMAILSSRIPFFRAVFNSNMVECSSREINISSTFCDYITLENLLLYTYTGRLTISEANVQDLIIAANFFNIDVLDECAGFMMKRITIDNVIPLLHFFEHIAYHKLEKLKTFIDKNLLHISFTSQFLGLSIKNLHEFLLRDSLYVDEESQVFDIVNRCIGENVERKKYAAQLLKCVRFYDLPKDFIYSMNNSNWITGNSECVAVINEAKNFITNNEKRADSNLFTTRARVCDASHRLIFSLRKQAGEDVYQGAHMEMYDPIMNVWIKCKNQKVSYHLNSIAVIEHKIYAFGGFIHQENGQLLDTVTNEIHKIPNMNSRRTQMAIGVIDKKIYVAGGYDDISTLSSMECFDSSTQEWMLMTRMAKSRSASASCSFNGKFYVFGGYDDLSCWDDGECYDPKTNSWNPIRQMNYTRWAAGAAVLNGQIYVAGGSDDRTVERYDPETDTWTVLKSMTIRRAYPTLAVSCGKLFVFGGFDQPGDDTVLTSVEMYHHETDCWEEREPLTAEYRDSIFIGEISIPASFPTPVTNIEHSGFRQFSLKSELYAAIEENGYNYPTKVQYEMLPQAILGMSVFCRAKSGMGKTVAFVIATLQQLEPVDGEVSVLVMCRSRERADLIGKRFNEFIKYMSTVKMEIFCGRMRKRKNISVLKNSCPHIVVGTPDNILTLVLSGFLKLDKIKHILIHEWESIKYDLDLTCRVRNIIQCTSRKQAMVFSETTSQQSSRFIFKQSL